MTSKKIDQYQLDDSLRQCYGSYSPGATGLPTRLTLDVDALDDAPQQRGTLVRGDMLNTNTIEDFKKSDKNALFKAASDRLWKVMEGEALEDPALLNRFFLIIFADLKKYKFYHWFAFPAFQSLSQPWKVVSTPVALEQVWSLEEVKQLRTQITNTLPFFLLKRGPNGVDVGHVKDWKAFFAPSDDIIVGFIDPSTLPTNPGWPLRNFLALLQRHFALTRLTVVCYREQPGNIVRPPSSIILTIEADPVQEVKSMPAAVGWERNSQGKLGPKMVDLAPMLDPKRLADTSVDLNLKLMRWRIVPDLKLEKIKETKVLLLGAGTLGCYVARILLGWGVRNITLVDNARVSYSNPVRQPLFDFEDCLEGGKPKAEAAAAALTRIYPGVNARGITLAIPMPGHPLESDKQGQDAVQQLEILIKEHDVVYLLMDSRESRWLPTLIGCAQGKLVMNAALGFDSFVVMRHGIRIGENRLGCYFCNDVVAPADSLTDRTLDQMCTVTRPGLAAVASANAVELMVSIIQHPDGAGAASETNTDNAEQSVLGIVPHQIRGFLGRFQSMLITGQAYDKCTACSQTVVGEYEKRGFEFLKQAFNENGYLEDLTGLSQLHDESADMETYEWDEDDDGEL